MTKEVVGDSRHVEAGEGRNMKGSKEKHRFMVCLEGVCRVFVAAEAGV